MDPPRKGVKESIEKFKKDGVNTIMITGDYIKTASAIGKEIGLVNDESQCISGEELDKLSNKEMVEIVEKKVVFARVSPEHKARIVTALKENGRIVAMTGDGVNDAPSLKKADIGIAMGINGSDVAKEASDMILLDDDFSTIETAIEEGRNIYNNIRKSVLFLLSSNFAEIIVMFFSIVMGLPLPLLAIHILIVNLLTDSIPALALGADSKDKSIMEEAPRKSEETLFSNGGLINTIVYGVVISFLTMMAFLLPSIQECFKYGVDINLKSIRVALEEDELLLISQTFAFVVLSLSELFYSLTKRNIRDSVFRKELLKNKLLNVSIVGGIIATGAMIYIPVLSKWLNLAKISTASFAILILISASTMLFHELIKPIVSRETKKLEKKHK
jgi:Ca2+-transporting ATPase